MSALIDMRPNISPARELAALIRDTEALRLRADLLSHHIDDLAGAKDEIDNALCEMASILEDMSAEPDPLEALRHTQDNAWKDGES